MKIHKAGYPVILVAIVIMATVLALLVVLNAHIITLYLVGFALFLLPHLLFGASQL